MLELGFLPAWPLLTVKKTISNSVLQDSAANNVAQNKVKIWICGWNSWRVLPNVYIYIFFLILVLWHLYPPLSEIYETTVLSQKGCDQSKMEFYHLQQCSTVLSNNHYKVWWINSPGCREEEGIDREKTVGTFPAVITPMMFCVFLHLELRHPW